MRPILFSVMAATLFAVVPAHAQKRVDFDAKTIQGDFAVPEAPALLMLGVATSKLLRPMSVQELTSNLASASDGFSILPKAFGVEFSPAMLRRGARLSIGEYQQNPMLYRARLSFAGNRDSAGKRSQLALGLRISLSDKSDLRTNNEVLTAFDSVTSIRVDSMRAHALALAANHLPLFGPYTPTQKKLVDSVAKYVADSLHDALKDRLPRAIAELKRAKESALWNADVLDVAFGLKASAKDSVAHKSRYDGAAAWLTKGWRLGDASQFLFGVRNAYERIEDDNRMGYNGDVVTRFYMGSNTAKVSAEAQATGRDGAKPVWGFRIGGEFETGRSIWIDYAAGWSAKGSLRDGTLTHTVKFNLAPPNK
ncbi:MAG: hypothetical protein ABI556_03700 [Gemmatimonadales bacterium]